MVVIAIVEDYNAAVVVMVFDEYYEFRFFSKLIG